MNNKINTSNIMSNKTILEEYDGHKVTMGHYAGQIRNKYRLIELDGEKCYEMDTQNEEKFYFSLESLPKILKITSDDMNFVPTWFFTEVGYISCSVPKNSNLYLHAWLMNHYGNGKGQDSVDHINQNKLDNRLSNLRVVNQSIQNINRPKKKRNKNAQALPQELNEITLPKFVTYNKEKMTKSDGSIYYRDFFRIEKHTKLDKTWSSSKSIKINILDKLEETNEKLLAIDNNTQTEKEEQKLPKYIYKTVDKRTNKNVLVYDRRNVENSKKESLRYTINTKLSLDQNLNILKDKVKNKYKYDLSIYFNNLIEEE